MIGIQILIQNINHFEDLVHIPEQNFFIDTSTRRKGGKMLELLSDERFLKTACKLDGKTEIDVMTESNSNLCNIGLFETILITVYFHAKGCSTVDKFKSKAKFLKVVAELRNKTVALPIHFDNI